MKPLLWKELRENWKWALAALVLAGVAYLYCWGLESDSYPGRFARGTLIQTATLSLSALFAFVLGWLQYARETRGDLRGVLVHRAMAPGTIFRAKVSAGLFLYLLGTLVPFAAAWAWIATPGNIPGPFRVTMVVPGLADILAGIPYYFAGVLAATRRAPWYGTRFAGLATAGFQSVLVFLVPSFLHALLATLVATFLLFAAARGSFLAGGRYSFLSVPARTGLFVSCLLCCVVLVWLVLLLHHSRVPPAIQVESWSYQLDRAGRVVLEGIDDGDWLGVRDLDGKPLNYENSWSESRAEISHSLSGTRSRRAGMVSRYRRVSDVIPLYHARGDRQPYYLVDERLVAVYDVDAGALIGYVGPTDAEPSLRPTSRFDADLQLSWHDSYYPSYLVFNRAVFRYRSEAHEMFRCGPGEEVLDARAGGHGDFWSRRLAIATTEAVYLLSADGTVVCKAVPPRSWDDFPRLHLAILDDDRFALWQRPESLDWESGRLQPVVQVVTADGTVESEMELPYVAPVVTVKPHAYLWGLVLPLGVAVPKVVSNDRWYGWKHINLLPVISLTTLVCAILVTRRTRRYAFSRSRTAWWIGLTVLLGPFAVLTLFSLEEWPAREACPHCRKKRVVTRAECEHCGERWLANAADGTEIFEEAA